MKRLRAIRRYQCDTCPAKGWRKFIIHCCADERGEGW